ncbi:MAG: hypothetical protein SNJ67_02620 [Chloracidobacterium sp.]|uniref:Uncharacterized protein n=1 Tax=Chloracidobacterium validum TaxID=2821543 RepID=A0ABX8BH92_9BACT|nr:hypothetical protein [Chloracidobacterium validum]QUW04455.1 hypothetical protein J8C06_11710 [Chloracidobacterium validum]
MRLRTFGKAIAFSLGGALAGVSVAVLTGFFLSDRLSDDLLPLLWLVGGVGGLAVGASQVSWGHRRRHRRRRRRPQVVLPPMMKPAGSSATSATASEASTGAVVPGDMCELFRQATDATPTELLNVRVCDIRLDGEGEPLSVRLTQNGQEREVFLVHDYHRGTVAEALEAALQREPGNRRAKLFA